MYVCVYIFVIFIEIQFSFFFIISHLRKVFYAFDYWSPSVFVRGPLLSIQSRRTYIFNVKKSSFLKENLYFAY